MKTACVIVERTWAPQSSRFLIRWPGQDCDGDTSETLERALHIVEFSMHGLPEDERPEPPVVVQEDTASSVFPPRLV